MTRTVHSLWRLSRPYQWIKNGFVLVGLLFGHAWSDRDLVTDVLLVLVAFCLASSAVYLSVTLFHQPLAPLATILSAVVVGSLCSVLMVLPAQLTVSAAAPDMVPLLHARLDAMRYVEGSRFGKNIVFRQDLPRFLRWDEADLVMRTEQETVIITGPVFMLKVIRSSLLRQLEPADGIVRPKRPHQSESS